MSTKRPDVDAGKSRGQRSRIRSLLCSPAVRWLQFWWTATLAVVAVCWAGAVLAVEPLGQQAGFVDQLLARQLAKLAEAYCEQQLARTSLPDGPRAELLGKWLEAIARQALDGPSPEALSQWMRMAELYESRRATVQDPLAVAQLDASYLQLQLVRAQANWQLAQLASAPERRQQEVVEQMREVRRELGQLSDQLAALLRARDVVAAADRLAVGTRLQQQVTFQTALVALQQAQTYPDQSPDQVNLLTQAVRQFEQLGRSVPPSPLTLTARLREIESLRRLGQEQDAAARLHQFPADAYPDFAGPLLLEQAELDLAAGRSDAALATLTQILDRDATPGVQTADLLSLKGNARLARIRAFLMQVAVARSDADLAQTVQQQIAAEIRLLEVELSPFWVRRAEALVTRSVIDPALATHADVALLERAAANLYRQRQLPEAIATFRRAAHVARERQLDAQAFTLDFQAAALHHELRQHAEAQELFLQLAREFSQHERAAEAHWLALVQLAQRLRADGTLLGEYERLLTEHLERWGSGPRASTVRTWFARLRAQQGKAAEAIQLWSQIPPTDPQFPAVLDLLRVAHWQTVESAAAGEESLVASARQAQGYFAKLAIEPGLSEAAGLNAAAALAAQEFALVTGTAGDFGKSVPADQRAAWTKLWEDRWPARLRAITLLQALTKGNDPQPADWRAVDWEQVDYVVPALRQVRAELHRRQGAGESSSLRRLIPLHQALAETNRWREQRELRRWQAEALAAGEQRGDGIAVLQRLVEEVPRDAQAWLVLASLQSEGGTVAEQQQALASWRRLLSLVPPNSDDWFRAKLGIAEALIATGDRPRAVATIRQLQALHPDLGGQAWRGRFEQLLDSS